MKFSDDVEKAISKRLKELSNPEIKGTDEDYFKGILSDKERENAVRCVLSYAGKDDAEKISIARGWNDAEMIEQNNLSAGLLF